MCSIRKAEAADAIVIHRLGHVVYHATYAGILSKEQIAFMLARNYSVAALQKAMYDREEFFILYSEDGSPLGFLALKEKGHDTLRIEKLYLLPSAQGQHLGKEMIDFAAGEARRRRRSVLELNVNRNNKAYYFYLKQGFHVVEEVDIPYFGYILDDYVMQKAVR